MNDINLEDLYVDGWVDLEGGEPLSAFIWMDLEYWRNGQTITIKPFKINALEMLSDLEYYQKHFDSHCDRVRDFCSWMDEQLDMLSRMDDNEEEYKSLAQDEWEEMDDDEKEEYGDDFDEYWEKYSSSNSFHQMVADDQSMQWDDFRNEFKDEFEIMDKALSHRSNYFDSYGNVTFNTTEKFDEAVDEIKEIVQDFLNSLYDANEMNNEQRINFFDNLFI